jgi:hypothetical protein
MFKKLLPLLFLFAGFQANSAIITSGFTFAVASSSSDQSVGSHYHSSTGGDYGNPSGLGEVGNYNSEEVRGISEYDLSGLSSASSAFVTFDTYGTGLFSGVNNFSFDGIIDIIAYQGNNSEDISDFHTASIASVGSFGTVGLSVTDVFSFDITTIFNDAIDNSWASLGIRLQTEDTVNGGGAWVFNDFRLTTSNESTDVPEPSIIVLFAAGLFGIGFARRRKA